MVYGLYNIANFTYMCFVGAKGASDFSRGQNWKKN